MSAPRCPIHGIPDCSPLLNGCSWKPAPSPASEPVSADVAGFIAWAHADANPKSQWLISREDARAAIASARGEHGA